MGCEERLAAAAESRRPIPAEEVGDRRTRWCSVAALGETSRRLATDGSQIARGPGPTSTVIGRPSNAFLLHPSEVSIEPGAARGLRMTPSELVAVFQDFYVSLARC